MEVEFDQVSFEYAGRPPRAALRDFDCALPGGQFLAVVGASGCGKSTLLRLAAGLLSPTGGALRLAGRAPEEAARRGEIAWMAQSPALLPWRTARANLALAAGRSASARGALSPDEALERVGLGGAQDLFPRSLSGGMQQRLALARLLTQGARLWLMDEPFAALDELTRERLALELSDLWQIARPTVVWVTHSLTEAIRLADRVVVVAGPPGRIAADLSNPLPRPRDALNDAFLTFARQVRAALESPVEAA